MPIRNQASGAVHAHFAGLMAAALVLGGCIKAPSLKPLKQDILYRHGAMIFDLGAAPADPDEPGELAPRQPGKRQLATFHQDLSAVPRAIADVESQLGIAEPFRRALAFDDACAGERPPLELPLTDSAPAPRGLLAWDDVRRLYSASFEGETFWGENVNEKSYLLGVRGYRRTSSSIFSMMSDDDTSFDAWEEAMDLDSIHNSAGGLYKQLWAVATARRAFFVSVTCDQDETVADPDALADAYALVLLLNLFGDTVPDVDPFAVAMMVHREQPTGLAARPGFAPLAVYWQALEGEEAAQARLEAARAKLEGPLRSTLADRWPRTAEVLLAE